MFFDTKFINVAVKLDTFHILCCTIKGLTKLKCVCILFPCNTFVYNFREVSIFDRVRCGGFIIMIKIQQLLLLFCICPFKNVNKIIAWKVYILNNKKTFSISITILLLNKFAM